MNAHKHSQESIRPEQMCFGDEVQVVFLFNTEKSY